MSMLYHYTSLQGLIGIVSNRSIWCSHCEYLNDSSEFNQAIDFAKIVSGSIFMDDDYLASRGYAIRHAIENMEKHNVFVTSFSEKADLLSQWRGYCPQGSGISLGFDQDLIKKYCEAKGFRLEKCIYDPKMLAIFIHSFIKESLEQLPQLKLTREEFNKLSSIEQCEFELSSRVDVYSKEHKDLSNKAIINLYKKLNEYAPLLKNQGFHEETEWRIIVNNPQVDIYYRPSKSYLIPYLILPILNEHPEILKEIYIGPSPETARCKTSIEYLLNDKNIKDVEIKISKIPFTSW